MGRMVDNRKKCDVYLSNDRTVVTIEDE